MKVPDIHEVAEYSKTLPKPRYISKYSSRTPLKKSISPVRDTSKDGTSKSVTWNQYHKRVDTYNAMLKNNTLHQEL